MNQPDRAGSVSWAWSRWRAVVAVVLLALLVVVLGVSALTPVLRVCEQAEAAAPVCRPLGWDDPVVLLTLVLAAVVGFPGIRRLEVGPGGLAAERDPELLSPRADVNERLERLEQGKVPEWYRETGKDGGGGDDERTAPGA